jgi:hypothetical protein
MLPRKIVELANKYQSIFCEAPSETAPAKLFMLKLFKASPASGRVEGLRRCASKTSTVTR